MSQFLPVFLLLFYIWTLYPSLFSPLLLFYLHPVSPMQVISLFSYPSTNLCLVTVYIDSVSSFTNRGLFTYFLLTLSILLFALWGSCALPLDPHCSLHIFYLAHFLSPESDDLDADLSRLASLGFTGCLSVVHFNTISPLKEALLRPNSSPVIITGPLAQSNCGSAASANSYSAENTHHLSGEKRRRHLTCYYVIIFENINM